MSAKQIPGTEFAEVLKALAEERYSGEYSKNITYQRCMVHGDLHLGNIMLGEHDIFIDFALSKVGPIAADVAKLVSDILLRVPTLRGDGIPEWTDKADPVIQVIEPMRAIMDFTSGDARLFGLLLRIYLAQALNYNDIPSDAKEWIKKAFHQC